MPQSTQCSFDELGIPLPVSPGIYPIKDGMLAMAGDSLELDQAQCDAINTANGNVQLSINREGGKTWSIGQVIRLH